MEESKQILTNNKNSYDAIAEQWSNQRKNSSVSSLVVDFADRIKVGGSILDIGCGTGVPLAKYLTNRKFSVTGVDFSEKMIQIAKANNIENSVFILSDFLDFNSVNKFDGILAWDSLWHFPKHEQIRIYNKVISLLNPGGYFLFTHGNVDGEHVDIMMEKSFYYSALDETVVIDQLYQNKFEIEFLYHDFIENKDHRSFVVLAKKNKMFNEITFAIII